MRVSIAFHNADHDHRYSLTLVALFCRWSVYVAAIALQFQVTLSWKFQRCERSPNLIGCIVMRNSEEMIASCGRFVVLIVPLCGPQHCQCDLCHTSCVCIFRFRRYSGFKGDFTR